MRGNIGMVYSEIRVHGQTGHNVFSTINCIAKRLRLGVCERIDTLDLSGKIELVLSAIEQSSR